MEHHSDIVRPVEEHIEESTTEKEERDVSTTTQAKKVEVVVDHLEALGQGKTIVTLQDGPDASQKIAIIECVWNASFCLHEKCEIVIENFYAF